MNIKGLQHSISSSNYAIFLQVSDEKKKKARTPAMFHNISGNFQEKEELEGVS